MDYMTLPDIAFTGKMGSGKSTAADAVIETGFYERVSFAEGLRKVCAQLWGAEARNDRNILQQVGVKMREVDPDVWCNYARDFMVDRRKRTLGASPRRFVCDDLRFENEYWMLKELGFLVVRVTADRDIRIDRLKQNGKLQDEEQLNHISETALDHIEADITIENNDDPFDFASAVAGIVKREAQRA